MAPRISPLCLCVLSTAVCLGFTGCGPRGLESLVLDGPEFGEAVSRGASQGRLDREAEWLATLRN